MTFKEACDLVTVIRMTSSDDVAAKYILGAFEADKPTKLPALGNGEAPGEIPREILEKIVDSVDEFYGLQIPVPGQDYLVVQCRGHHTSLAVAEAAYRLATKYSGLLRPHGVKLLQLELKLQRTLDEERENKL